MAREGDNFVECMVNRNILIFKYSKLIGKREREGKGGSTQYLKLNVHASIVLGSPSFSGGWVLRNHVGAFKGDQMMRINREVSVEVLGILEALAWWWNRV